MRNNGPRLFGQHRRNAQLEQGRSGIGTLDAICKVEPKIIQFLPTDCGTPIEFFVIRWSVLHSRCQWLLGTGAKQPVTEKHYDENYGQIPVLQRRIAE